MNDWVDVNCFFTVGKSMTQGLVPYRDLYEQKGPVLYFVYAILSLFSRKTYFFVYLLEVITYGAFLYYSGRIAKLYVRDSFVVSLLVTIEGGLIVLSRAFSHGASVEEMCLFMSAYALFVTLRARRKKRTLFVREAFLCGVWAGCLLWIKYTMLGLYLGIAVFILISYGIEGKWRELIAVIGEFFAGLGVVSAVVLLYFALNGAMEELFTVYFYNNIFLYAKNTESSRFLTILQCLGQTLKYNRVYTLLFIPGALWIVWEARRDAMLPLLLVMCFFGTALGTYWGGWAISYYGLVFAAFSIFGLIPIGCILKKVRFSALFGETSFLRSAMKLIALLAMLCACLTNGRNLYLIGQSRETMPQYRFAEIMQTTENATLLNYGFLDGGFYYAADITPNCRFFCALNVNAPDMWSTQREYIEQGKVDYVVTRDAPLGNYALDSSRYACVDIAEQYFEGYVWTYYLYQLIA